MAESDAPAESAMPDQLHTSLHTRAASSHPPARPAASSHSWQEYTQRRQMHDEMLNECATDKTLERRGDAVRLRKADGSLASSPDE